MLQVTNDRQPLSSRLASSDLEKAQRRRFRMSDWKLVDQDTGLNIAVGDGRTTFQNESVTIDRLEPPDQPGSLGRVHVRFADGSTSHGLFPGVVNAEFVDVTGPRAGVERDALDAPLPDAAFVIISYNMFHSQFGPLPHARPIDPLRTLRRRFSESEIRDACRKAIALLQEVHRPTDDLFSKQLTHADLVNGFRERHPGFSNACYEDTIRQGYFINR